MRPASGASAGASGERPASGASAGASGKRSADGTLTGAPGKMSAAGTSAGASGKRPVGGVFKGASGASPAGAFLHIKGRTVFFLCLLLLTACLVGLSKYLFEGRLFVFYDIGSDTWQQYISLYGAISRKLSRGDLSPWCSTIGFGTNLFMLNPGNPALIVAYLLGAVFGSGILPSLMVYLYIAEIFAAGISAYLFLSAFSFGEMPKLLASFLYAFSGFMVVWGQHYQFAIVPTLLMLELLMAERWLRRRGFAGLVLSTALAVFSSMYIAYMMLLFTGVYLLLRIFLREKSFLGMLWEAARTLWPLLLGVGIGMVTLLPSAEVIFHVSSRMERTSSLAERLFHPLSFGYYKALLARLLSCAGQGINDVPGIYLNYYEGPCLFFTPLFLLLLAQYVFLLKGRRIARRRKVLFLVLIGVGVLSVLTPTAGTVFNGFTATFNRYMFLLMPGFSLLCAAALEEILKKGRFSVPAAVLASLAILAGYGWLLLWGKLETRIDLVLWAHALAALAMASLLFAAARRREGASLFLRLAPLLLCLVLLANVCAEMTANFRTRGSVPANGTQMSLLQDADTLAALEGISESDPGCFRVEKLYGATGSMDAPFQGYRSLSNYSSTMNANVHAFAKAAWPGLFLWDDNHLTYRTAAASLPLTRLLGVKYLLVKEGMLDYHNMEVLEGTGEVPEGFEKVSTHGDVSVYRDFEVEGILSFYPQEAVESDGPRFEMRDRACEIAFLASSREDVVEARVNAKEDGLLFAAIPFEKGWHVFVDGKEAELEQVCTGFCGVRLTAGTHQVRFGFACPGLFAGFSVSLVFLGVFLFLVFFFRRRR